MTAPITGIAAVLIPVAHLGRSVPWYAELLDLVVSREFVVEGRLWGAVLRSRTADFAVILQDRAAAPAVPDLRGTHPVVFALPHRSAVEQLAERGAALGCHAVTWSTTSTARRWTSPTRTASCCGSGT